MTMAPAQRNELKKTDEYCDPIRPSLHTIFFLPSQLKDYSVNFRNWKAVILGLVAGIVMAILAENSPIGNHILPQRAYRFLAAGFYWACFEIIAAITASWLAAHQARHWMNSGRIDELRLTFIPPMRLGQVVIYRILPFPLAFMLGLFWTLAFTLFKDPGVSSLRNILGLCFYSNAAISSIAIYYTFAWISLVIALSPLGVNGRLWLLFRAGITLAICLLPSIFFLLLLETKRNVLSISLAPCFTIYLVAIKYLVARSFARSLDY